MTPREDGPRPVDTWLHRPLRVVDAGDAWTGCSTSPTGKHTGDDTWRRTGSQSAISRIWRAFALQLDPPTLVGLYLNQYCAKTTFPPVTSSR